MIRLVIFLGAMLLGGTAIFPIPAHAGGDRARQDEKAIYRQRIQEEQAKGKMDAPRAQELKARESARQREPSPPPRPASPALNR